MVNSHRRALAAVVRDEAHRQLARCLLHRGRYIIGQELKNEIAVDHPSVSAQHARLTILNDEEAYIEDLYSANGTMVNGRPVDEMTAVPLDAEVKLGSCTLQFQRGGLPAVVFQAVPDSFLREHRYEVGDVVVEGSTSTILAGFDTALGREVAIKVMRPESQAVAETVLRFIREAQITSQLQHPGILPIYELGLDEQSRLFYTTRFVEGESLGAILDALGAEDPSAAVRHRLAVLLNIFQKACDAVWYAHTRGVLHGALQPESIRVGACGEVFVVNWGRARALAHDPRGEPYANPMAVTADSTALREPTPFSAPEQAGGNPEAGDERADVFALGGILYRILCLRAPTAAGSGQGPLAAAAVEPLSSLQAEILPHCPAGHMPLALCAAAMRALSADPEERHASVAELQQEVAAYQEGLAAG